MPNHKQTYMGVNIFIQLNWVCFPTGGSCRVWVCLSQTESTAVSPPALGSKGVQEADNANDSYAKNGSAAKRPAGAHTLAWRAQGKAETSA